VKVFVIIGIVLALGFIISLIAGVRHGPGMHPSSDGQDTPPSEQGP
jgi:hypothetical protein